MMAFPPKLTEADRSRCARFMTRFLMEDKGLIEQVLQETDAGTEAGDESAVTGLMFALANAAVYAMEHPASTPPTEDDDARQVNLN